MTVIEAAPRLLDRALSEGIAAKLHSRREAEGQCDDAGRLSAAAGIGPGNAVAKNIRILENLIERAATFDPNLLADSSQNLKRLLKAA